MIANDQIDDDDYVFFGGVHSAAAKWATSLNKQEFDLLQ